MQKVLPIHKRLAVKKNIQKVFPQPNQHYQLLKKSKIVALLPDYRTELIQPSTPEEETSLKISS